MEVAVFCYKSAQFITLSQASVCVCVSLKSLTLENKNGRNIRIAQTGREGMPHQYEQSPLEKAFEELFSQTFQLHWSEVLVAQYEVKSGGKHYFLDFAYINDNERIGIELDGRRKFFEFKHVFRDFFNRQNAIQLAGFTVYRFTWADVVDQGGWRARKQLKQIFRGKVFTRSGQLVPVAIADEEPPKVIPSLPVALRNWLTRLGTNHRQANWENNQPDKVLEYVPATSPGTGLMKGFIVGVVVLGSAVVAVEFIRSPQVQPPPENTPAISTSAPISSIPSRGNNQPENMQIPKPIAPHVVERIVRVPVKSEPSRIVSAKKAMSGTRSVIRVQPNTAKKNIPQEETVPIPIESPVAIAPQPVEAPPPVDEIVAYNQRSGIFHRLNCTWAKRCRHCITIHMSEAVKMGGRPAKTCDPL